MSQTEEESLTYVCEECSQEVESTLDVDSFSGLCKTCTGIREFKRKEE